MTTRTLTRPTDTSVSSAKPAASLSRLSYMELTEGNGYGFLYWPLPFARGATITQAKLRVYTFSNTDVTRTMYARLVADKVNYSTMTWDTQPAGVSPGASLVSSTAGAGQLWEIDVTALMQQVSDGALWWGLRLSVVGDPIRVHSAQSQYATSRPTLLVQWSDRPDEPGDLAPDGGQAASTDKPVLRFTYADYGGNTELAGAEVQIAEDAAFVSGLWGSGEQPVTLPEFDLSDPAISDYAGLPGDGSVRYWRVRVKDGAGLWSGWSPAAQMRFVERGLVTVTEPIDGGSLMDPTPIVAWSFSGTQVQYQVVVQRGDKVRIPVWDSGRRTGVAQRITVPSGILRDDKTYTFTVRVWDDVDRAATPGHPAFRQQSVTVWFDDDLPTPAPDAITVSPRGQSPFVDVSWVASVTPDAFMLTRDGVIVGRWTPGEVRVDGTLYEFTDRTCPPGVEVEYRVHSIVAGKRSGGRGQAARAHTSGVWLTTPDTHVCLTGKDLGSPTLGSVETVHELASRVVVISEGQRGHEGDWSGELHSDITIAPGVTAKEWRDRFMQIRDNPVDVRLHMGPVNIPVALSAVSVRANSDPELSYTASFTYHQLDGPELDDITTVG